MADTGSTFSRGTSFVGIEIRTSPIPGLRAQLKRIGSEGIKLTMAEVGEFWHREILPKHFRESNKNEYHIAPRTQKYWIGNSRPGGGFSIGNKRRYGIGKGTSVANVFSGQTERRMMHEYDVTSTSKSATVTMNAPAYFTNPYDPFGNQPDKVRETLEVSRNDVYQLQNFAIQRLMGYAVEALKAA